MTSLRTRPEVKSGPRKVSIREAAEKFVDTIPEADAFFDRLDRAVEAADGNREVDLLCRFVDVLSPKE